MKFQPKRFVVEVKRGTSRASFASPDPSTAKFSNAEAMLFGASSKADTQPAPPVAAKKHAPSGRVLRSLVEPPPPVVEDEPPPVRRGRKPGSKNKPKPQVLSDAPVIDVERPRRGRKPGSKNKPKAPIPTAFPTAAAASQQSLAAMRSYGFADEATADWAAPAPPLTVEPPAPAAPAAAETAALEVAQPRTRLRERSTILKRYVLGIEPSPGQPGALRTRRLRRAS